MKTVMKKMFSLLLVAVLMVGVMPFQASAAMTAKDGYVTVPVKVIINHTDEFEKSIQIPEGGSVDLTWEYAKSTVVTKNHDIRKLDYWANANGDDVTGRNLSASWLTDPVNGPDSYSLTLYVTENSAPEHTHTWSDATCTLPKTCSCGATEGEALNHAWSNATCALPKTCSRCGETAGEALGHTWAIDAAVAPTCTAPGKTEGKHCTVCGATNPAQEVILATGHTAGAAATCTTAQTCSVCGETLVAALGHSVDDATNKCTRCGKDFAQDTPSVPTGTSKLHVWANLYVGKEKVNTILLDTIEGLSGDAKIYQVVSDNRARLVSKFPAGYGIESWTNNIYFMIDADTKSPVTSRLTVGEEDDAVINLYAQQKLVVARVHLTKTYAVDMAVQLNGFRVGDTVTEKDVKNAIKKYYSVSGMKIYTPAEWENVVAGKDANNITNFIVQGGDNDNVYEVYISGARNTYANSTTYKADSTNPKTGDMIFAPVAVLGLSASALAVLFFLNKKRAF